MSSPFSHLRAAYSPSHAPLFSSRDFQMVDRLISSPKLAFTSSSQYVLKQPDEKKVSSIEKTTTLETTETRGKRSVSKTKTSTRKKSSTRITQPKLNSPTKLGTASTNMPNKTKMVSPQKPQVARNGNLANSDRSKKVADKLKQLANMVAHKKLTPAKENKLIDAIKKLEASISQL